MVAPIAPLKSRSPKGERFSSFSEGDHLHSKHLRVKLGCRWDVADRENYTIDPINSHSLFSPRSHFEIVWGSTFSSHQLGIRGGSAFFHASSFSMRPYQERIFPYFSNGKRPGWA